jgi:hypothetical protein
MDYLPEESYDSSTGEYSSGINFEPVFKQRVQIAPGIFADIVSFIPDFEPLAENIANKLDELIREGQFDIPGNRNPNFYPSIPPEFDYGGKTTRGAFPDSSSVERFLDESGLRDIALAYYDEEYDEYWIDVNTS